MNHPNQYNRRDWLKLLGLGAAGGLAGGVPFLEGSVAQAQTSANTGRRLLRVAHLTDVHVQPERGAGEGLAACLRHVQSQSDKPDLILITGDCVMDSYRKQRDRTQLQWDLWKSVMKTECSLPVMPLLGNHDIWGWDKAKSKTVGTEEGWGKRWACDELGLDRAYYSFDRAGWHFVMLDSVQPFDDRSYTAHLDEAQFDWLEGDLKQNAGKPTMILSHIPILSITPIIGQKPEIGIGSNGEKNTQIGHASMHNDWREIRALFRQHPDVKLAVSGHIHLLDRVDCGGVSYCCNGAVSGGWWKEPNLGEGEAGYALIDLFDDGRFTNEYVTYGWEYRPAEAKAPAAATAR